MTNIGPLELTVRSSGTKEEKEQMAAELLFEAKKLRPNSDARMILMIAIGALSS